MGLWWQLAFRNIFRNKRRTYLTALVIGIGLACLMLVDGLVIGMNQAMVKSATETFLGHAQIHAPGFRDTFELEKTIPASREALEKLRRSDDVAAVSPRLVAGGMLSSSSNVQAVTLFGIDPAQEARVSALKRAIVKGEYLDSDDRGILLGKKLAETLEVSLGDRVVMTIAQAGTGELAQELFRVSGIFYFNSRQMDGSMAFASLPRAQKMAGLPGEVHEIALRFHGLAMARDRNLPIWKEISQAEFLAWYELMPSLEAMIEMAKYTTAIMASILFAIIVIGVINTLFMALYERMFEFGVIRGVGTRPKQVAMMIMLETFALGLVAVVMGLAIGTAAVYYYSLVGIDYTDLEMMGVTIYEPIKLVLRVGQFTELPLLVLVLTLLAGVYPAIHAARIVPAEAMRKSL